MATARRIAEDALDGFGHHGTSQMAAALAYYSALSIVPLAVVVLVVTGLVVDTQMVATVLLERTELLLGSSAAELIGEAVDNALSIEGSGLTVVLGVGAVLFGATSLLLQLQVAMRRIFELELTGGIKGQLVKRFVSLAVIGVLAVALLFTLVVWWGASALFPGRVSQLVQSLVRIGVLGLVVAAGYRWLARTNVRLRAVIVGTVFAVVGLLAASFVMGLYFSSASVGSVYGAAGALVVVLVWVFVVAQVFLAGAEIVRATDVEYRRQDEMS